MATLNYAVSKDTLWKNYKQTKLRSLIEEFRDSDADIVQVMYAEDEYSSANTLSNALRQAMTSMKVAGVKTAQRGTHVFLYKE